MDSQYTNIFINLKATCDDKITKNVINKFENEIIEISAIVFDFSGNIIDSIQIIIRPVINPQLTELCKSISGIRQEWVDGIVLKGIIWASDIIIGMNIFVDWINKYNNPMLFTYGGWDLEYMIPIEIKRYNLFNYDLHSSISKSDIPHYLRKWCDIKIECCRFYNLKSQPLKKVLNQLKITFNYDYDKFDFHQKCINILLKMISNGFQPIFTKDFIVKPNSPNTKKISDKTEFPVYPNAEYNFNEINKNQPELSKNQKAKLRKKIRKKELNLNLSN